MRCKNHFVSISRKHATFSIHAFLCCMGSVGEPIVRGLDDNTSSVDWDLESIPQASIVHDFDTTSAQYSFWLPFGNTLDIYDTGGKWIDLTVLFCLKFSVSASYCPGIGINMETGVKEAERVAVNMGRETKSLAAICCSGDAQSCAQNSIIATNAMCNAPHATAAAACKLCLIEYRRVSAAARMGDHSQ